MMSPCRTPSLVVGALAVVIFGTHGEGADSFGERIEPFAKKYCHQCHNAKEAKGELDMTRYRGERDVVGDFRKWNAIIEFVRDGEMPPDDAPQPTLEERNAAISAIRDILLAEARKTAGDPGPIPPRRLSNTEYDLSIRDLTGVAIRATAEFPVDPAGGEGFDNTGEALGMTPSLLNKYLGAAQFVSEHLVLKPTGISFAPFPVTSYNERKKFTEQAIIDFYRRHDVRIGAYLEAAWRFRHRDAAEQAVEIEGWGAGRGLSGKYLRLVYETLEGAPSGSLFLKRLGNLWRTLPAPKSVDETPEALRELEAEIEATRAWLGAKEPPLIDSNAGNWPIAHLARRAKASAARDQFTPEVFQQRLLTRFPRLPNAKPAKANETPQADATTLYLRVDFAPEVTGPGYVILKRPVFTKADHPPRNDQERSAHAVETLQSVMERHAPDVAERLAFGKHPRGGAIEADWLVVEAPTLLELPISAAAALELQGKQLVVDVELDATHSRESAVFVQTSLGKPPTASSAARAQLLLMPESRLAAEFAESGTRFCRAFPNRFYYVDGSRGLAAGFHLVEGFFRDDRPLVEKVLSDDEVAELDRLWRELDFVTQSVETLLRGLVWFERAERHVLHDKRFDFLRSEDPALVEPELLAKFERHYLEKLGVKLRDGEGLAPQQPNPQFDLIHGFFERTRAGLAEQQRALAQAEAPALADLRRLAERAFCRELRAEEAESLDALYHRLRQQGQGIEESLRGVLAGILMSPDFFYRIPETSPGAGVFPLSDRALARRLAGFVWSSLPDEPLLAASRTGELQSDAALLAHTRRMLRDPRSEAFAREFFGQWLRYRDYLAKDPIPANVFPGYDERLRKSLFDEPTRMLTHLVRHDLPVDEVLHADWTFVNEPLAKFYGGSIESQYRELVAKRGGERAAEEQRTGNKIDLENEWHRVKGMRSLGRGGLLGMPVVLAKNSAGQRTSPVKRGFWVVHHVLGQHFPPPPANVPELPKSEKEANKTIRELLADHTQVKQCAMCHVHFDGLGLVMEGFDAIGRARRTDLAGRPVQTTGARPGVSLAEGADGSKKLEGIAGLIEYIEQERREDWERTLCRKFLGYALGRSVLLSDEPLLETMRTRLRSEQRISVLFESVVLSPQFRRQRGAEEPATRP